MSNNAIAKAVRARRNYIGMKVGELAAKCGWVERTFQKKMENPERMTLEDMRKIEKIRGMEKGELARL